ncbi:hypothetical protein ACGF7U_31260 [Micromonospora sp. NPDC047670]|uniref:hypothetical protein n=1 Tax=Micromonospora sp. NPDC047670 TaxID=3364252 RepID=UPI003716FAFA
MTGPDTGGPPSGPGITLNLPIRGEHLAERTRREAAAWSAGAEGTSASPLSREQREDRYRTQTGSRRTARQRRRIEHKARRALASAAR